jgi:hypothetical protein
VVLAGMQFIDKKIAYRTIGFTTMAVIFLFLGMGIHSVTYLVLGGDSSEIVIHE